MNARVFCSMFRVRLYLLAGLGCAIIHSACGVSEGRRPPGFDPGNSPFSEMGGAAGYASESDGGNGGAHPEKVDTDNGVEPGSSFGGAVRGPVESVQASCDPDRGWSGTTSVGKINNGPRSKRLLSLSPNEMTLVFVEDDTVWVSDRALMSERFDKKKKVVSDEISVSPESGGALTADGFSLILVNEEESGFVLFQRASLDDEFQPAADQSSFSILNQIAGQSGARLSYPVLSPENEQIFWIEELAETGLWVSPWDGSVVSRGSQVGCNEWGCDHLLEGYMGVGKYVTSISGDGQSLLLMDDSNGPEIWQRELEGGSFVTQSGLAYRAYPQLSPNCERIYFSTEGQILFESAN